MDNKLEQLFYLGLGSALTMKDKMEKNSEELRKWQGEAEQNARAMIDELTQRGEQEKDAFRRILKDSIKEVIEEMDLVTREDLEQFKKELDR